MSHLIKAYLHFLSTDDGAHHKPMPPLADDTLAPSFTIKVLDMFCK